MTASETATSAISPKAAKSATSERPKKEKKAKATKAANAKAQEEAPQVADFDGTCCFLNAGRDRICAEARLPSLQSRASCPHGRTCRSRTLSTVHSPNPTFPPPPRFRSARSRSTRLPRRLTFTSRPLRRRTRNATSSGSPKPVPAKRWPTACPSSRTSSRKLNLNLGRLLRRVRPLHLTMQPMPSRPDWRPSFSARLASWPSKFDKRSARSPCGHSPSGPLLPRPTSSRRRTRGGDKRDASFRWSR